MTDEAVTMVRTDEKQDRNKIKILNVTSEQFSCRDHYNNQCKVKEENKKREEKQEIQSIRSKQ